MRRGTEEKGRGKLHPACSFSVPIYFFLVQPEENLTVLQDKKSKGKK